jgi:hypothetical protein
LARKERKYGGTQTVTSVLIRSDFEVSGKLERERHKVNRNFTR